MIRDLRFALRSFRHHRLTSAIALLSLAVGVGGTAAVFDLIDTVVLKRLPVSDPDRLFSATLVLRQGVFDNFSYTQFQDLRSTPAFSAMAAWSPDRFEVQWSGENESIPGLAVTPEYFTALGIVPAIGRFPAAAETGVVISYGLWDHRFNRSVSVLNQNIRILGKSYVITGVAPREFFGTEVGSLPGLFVPFDFSNAAALRLKLVGRLSPGATVQQANVQLNARLQRQLLDDLRAAPSNTPDQMKRDYLQQRIELVRCGAFSPVRREFTRPLLVLMALVGLVLLIACGNVANLLVVRAVSRSPEMTIRLACGAGRWRIVRLLLVEGLVLSLPGTAAGAILAQWLRPLLISMMNTRRATIGLQGSTDARFLGFTAALAVLTGLLFGLVPAFHSLRKRRGMPIGRLLVVLQVALSLCLLVGAGLFVRTLVNLKTLDAGFDRRQTVLMRIPPERGNLYSQLLDAVRRIPGVQSASLSRFTPIESSALSDGIRIDGESVRASINFVEPQFFETLGTPLLAGRDFEPGDAVRSVAIVNDSLVRRYFAGRNPVGQHFRLAGPNGTVFEIVGVARDMKYRDLRETVPVTVFYSALQNPSRLGSPQLSVRIRGAIGGAAEAVRRSASGLGISVGEATTMEEQVDDSLVEERVMAHLSGVLGVFALLLTSTGLYGVISYATARRTKEIGIRIALGAEPSAVVRSIVRETLALIAAGIGLGLPGLFCATRLVRAGLFGVTPWDPVTMASSVLLLLAVAALAGYLPARNASLVNPMVALRSE